MATAEIAREPELSVAWQWVETPGLAVLRTGLWRFALAALALPALFALGLWLAVASAGDPARAARQQELHERAVVGQCVDDTPPRPSWC